jgi:hypothetical protein
MAEETKVPVAPKATVEEKLIDNPRTLIENSVILENETVPAQEPAEKVETEEPATEATEPVSEEEISAVERIKQNVQKRINQVVAQKKSAEEQLAEAQAEIARLKSSKTTEAVTTEPKKDEPGPTIEQVEAYIIKMAEEGNKREEIAATRYLIKLEKESAIKEVEERQAKVQTEAQRKAQAESKALLELAKDYIVYDTKGQPDMTSDMTLANQKGKLFETAMALYNDRELHSQFYNDPDRSLGFRRAVQDAKRELHAQGLVSTPKADVVEPRRIQRQVLAEPATVEVEESSAPSNSNLLSDAEKVREEIKQRSRMRNSRKPS